MSGFPDGFLWGTATAAHQVEGGNVGNDGWFLEHLPRTIFAEPSGDACDHYHRYAQDIATVAALGLNSYRFSVEWSRVELVEGEFSLAALDHYRRMLEACHAHGLTPVVTYNHFTSPLWLLAAGGWEDAATPDRFARYCEKVTAHLGDLVGRACTLNEPNLPNLLEVMGIGGEPAERRGEVPMWADAAAALGIPAARVAPFQFTISGTGFATRVAAHRAGTAAIKAVRPDLPVGWTLALTDVQSVPGGEDRAASVAREVNDVYLEAARGDDFVGVQNYGRHVFDADGLVHAGPGAVVNQLGEELYPQGLANAVRHAAAVSEAPVVVTENGLSTADDAQRQWFVEEALRGLREVVAEGVDVRGYTYWSLLDNFEWIFGYRPTFGLVAVDRTTFARTVKPSAVRYGQIARSNGALLGP
ncbi:MAG: glycoside hydrolase family 1 protein [Actinobacteria bacterium]|nr:glycoside hydrolase family 1 protein [Actinomycetota bacterium]